MSDQVELLKEAVHTFLPSYLPSYRRDISFLECFTHFPKITHRFLIIVLESKALKKIKFYVLPKF